MRYKLPALVGVLLAVSFGVAEGLWTGRWRTDDDVKGPAARLANVPMTFGEWEGSAMELEQRQLTIGKIDGYVMRSYVNRHSGDSISVLLVCGRPGPISAHTPDICFPGGGVEMQSKMVQHKVEIEKIKKPAEFWAARFGKGQGFFQSSAVMWSWTTDGNWSAPENPRIRFGRSPALFKLYVIHPMTKPDQVPTEDRDLEGFLQEFLPVVQNALFPPT